MIGTGLIHRFKLLLLQMRLRDKCELTCLGHLKNCTIKSYGSNNKIYIAKNTNLLNTQIILKGSNCIVDISENSGIRNSYLFIEHDNSEIGIGNSTTIEGASLLVSEPNQSIQIGEDCMFSHDITVRTSDSHKIMDERTGERINPPMSVKIEDHVWIGAGVTILKGSHIGDHVVVGAQSLVNKPLEAHAIYAGIPAKKIRDSITWER